MILRERGVIWRCAACRRASMASGTSNVDGASKDAESAPAVRQLGGHRSGVQQPIDAERREGLINVDRQSLRVALDGVGEALLEDELVIVADSDRNHQGAVGRQGAGGLELDELAQEVVLRLLVVGDDVLDHDDRVVRVRLLERRQQLRQVQGDLLGVLGQARSNDHSLHERVARKDEHVADEVAVGWVASGQLAVSPMMVNSESFDLFKTQ